MKKHFIYVFMMLFCTSYIAADLRECDQYICSHIKKLLEDDEWGKASTINYHPFIEKCFSDQPEFTEKERRRLLDFWGGIILMKSYNNKNKK